MQERWNDNMKVVIVGGVAGGATAAARIRRLNEQAEIVVFERSGYISYANCGLPYYIGDVITDRSDLTLQTPESFFSRFHVNMKVRHEVTAIHPEEKTVSVKNLETGEEFEESYDKLILSPGAKPTQPRLPGVGLNKLFTLRTVEDTFRLDVSRCATQRLGGLSHTQRHRHRFRTTDSRHHFTLHQLNNSLSLLLVNHTRRFYKPKHGLMTDLG